jgi:hypothetical protein
VVVEMRRAFEIVGIGSALLVASCTKTPPAGTARAQPSATIAARPSPSALPYVRPSQTGLAAHFTKARASFTDAEYPALESTLALPRPKDSAPGFDVRKAKYFDLVTSTLKLDDDELGRLQRRGFVSVDHRQRYSMGSAYAAIYGRDLPLLVTTDSVLNALHRSYDSVLIELEVELFSDTLRATLVGVQQALLAASQQAKSAALRDTLGDIDVFVSVAQNLLEGAGTSAEEPHSAAATGLPVAPMLGSDTKVLALLEKVRALTLEMPDRSPPTELNGGKRFIDYTQFRVRGHYTQSPELRRYFRALMWLGRPDLGFYLDGAAGVGSLDVKRERRGAFVLVQLLEQSKQLERLRAMSAIVDFLIGRSDDFSIDDVLVAAQRAGIASLDDTEDEPRLERAVRDLGTLAARSQIRGQVQVEEAGSTTPAAVPKVFQVFGQRFNLDSFVLSRVTFDSIVFKGDKRRRMLPSGLDVMAAFGNDAAVGLLRPEIELHGYAGNLLALRQLIGEQKPEVWDASVYGIWLDALRTLDDTPDPKLAFPAVLRSEAWQKKQLQTQLASWAELRHDTILYAKQSYTVVPGCGYPAGYVEPYPAFYRRLQALADEAARRLRAADVSHSDAQKERELGYLREREASFFQHFASRMSDLERLAQKELEAQPFTQTEEEFLKKAVDRTMVGSGHGVPVYTGWYSELLYDHQPERWQPTVADVHSDPASGQVLEVGVGDVNFLVLAVDNRQDRAIYVGPVYSYYEFTQPIGRRMNDSEWSSAISSGKQPQRPDWTRAFQAAGRARVLPPATHKPENRARY